MLDLSATIEGMSNINSSSPLRPVNPAQTATAPPKPAANAPVQLQFPSTSEAPEAPAQDSSENQVDIKTQNSNQAVSKEFRFVSEDLFGGYDSQAVRDPGTPLKVAAQRTYTPPAGTSFEDFVGSMDSPDKVAAFGRPFGNTLYNYDRANNGEGPGGTQTPRETFETMSAICRDIGQLQAYALQENGYNALQMGYKSQGVLHAVATYEGKNGEGFGVVEYGTNYSPEDIAKVLGRPALSHEEALLAVRPEAKLINSYTRPEADAEGSIDKLYYTTGHKLYNETLRLKHENSASFDNQTGVTLEAALGDHWGIKLNANTGSSPDPTAKNSLSAAVGYHMGDADNGMKISAGVQYRPEEGHHSIGSNTWEQHEAIVAGLHAEGQMTPFRANLGENHETRTVISGDLTTALAFSEGEGTDSTGSAVDGKWGLDSGLTAGLSHANLRLSQHLDGQLTDKLSYRSEAFIAPDIIAMSYGVGGGGSGLYSNVGVNGSLHYEMGNFDAHVGAQYLFAQVNNLEATGVSTGVSYNSDRWSLSGGVNAVESPEGLRLQSQQRVNLKITDSISAYGYASQEKIFNDTHGSFSNPSGQRFGLGITGRF